MSQGLRRVGQQACVDLVLREARGVGDEALELAERDLTQGLEDLLVGPVRLTRLLEEEVGRVALRLDGALEESEQRRLLLVGRREAPVEGDLVEAKAAQARRACELREAVAVAPVLGDGEADPDRGGGGQRALMQLRAQAGIGLERRGRA